MTAIPDLDDFLDRVRQHEDWVRSFDGSCGPVAGTDERALALRRLRSMFADLLAADEELRAQNAQLEAAQLELAAARGRYQDLFDSAPIAYLVTDADGVIQEANVAAGDLLGEPRHRGVGTPVQRYVEASSRSALRRLLLQLRREGGVASTEVGFRRAAGRTVRTSVTIARPTTVRAGQSMLRWGVNPAPPDPPSTPIPCGLPAPREPRSALPGRSDDSSLDSLRVLIDDPGAEVVVLDEALRVRRASRALAPALPADGLPAAAVFGIGAAAVEPIAAGCLQRGRVVRDVEIVGRPRPCRWRATFVPLLGDPGRVTAVAVLLVPLPPDRG